MDTLTELLGSRGRAEVLRLLFGLSRNELHVREIARRAGLSDATVRQELKRLARLELVEMRRSGNRAYYRANADHPLHVDLRNLVLKTSGLVDVLRAVLSHPGIQVAFVFGSLAEGSEGAESDVDLMVVGKIRMRELSARLPEAIDALEREINPHILSAAEFARRKQARDHFLMRVLGSRKLFVIGDEHDLAEMG
ncbi:MAG: MarR family transcriptional regulator [Candidatus Eisenbacteria bacterium]|nr:MarR family transcriptional regulator [Candidatus Eisenbacteria bacterium]